LAPLGDGRAFIFAEGNSLCVHGVSVPPHFTVDSALTISRKDARLPLWVSGLKFAALGY
jgi:hypothetical protein